MQATTERMVERRRLFGDLDRMIELGHTHTMMPWPTWMRLVSTAQASGTVPAPSSGSTLPGNELDRPHVIEPNSSASFTCSRQLL